MMVGVPRPRLAVATLLATLAFALPLVHAQPLVRVLLAEVPTTVVAFDGAHRGVIDGRPFATAHALAWPLEAVGDELWVDGRAVGRTLDLASDEGVRWDGRAYRGTLRMIAADGALRIVNVLDLESYLRGVVPSEMQASWPLEALKAQAVAARTYTLLHVDPAGDYDVCATIDCQVYRGRSVEHAASDAAIAATAGEVLTYGGAFARTYYHADSGGVIASAAEVWGSDLPYLQAFQDVASDGPHARWTARLDPAVVAARLRTIGVDVGAVQRLEVLEVSSSGRVVRAEVVGTGGRRVLSGTTLRNQLRAWNLKSTRFVMSGDLTVVGEGWGHGVGMSQYGALALARQGYTYAQILAFYYEDTVLQRLTTQASR
jgi:stage II sporulation protein D